MLHAITTEASKKGAAKVSGSHAAFAVPDIAPSSPGNQALLRAHVTPLLAPSRVPILQRQCNCGGSAGASGECAECKEKKDGSKLQTKLAVNEPGDKYEQEAERIAELVTGRADFPAVQGAASSVQRDGPSFAAVGEAAPPIVDRALDSPGQSLDPASRGFFESRFGHDFGSVRVHDGVTAAQAADAVQAHAFTVGADVVFASGRYAPGTDDGRRLLAHELTHVVQQGAAGAAPGRGRFVQRYSYDSNCSADTRSAIMGGFKLATWATKRAQLMLQAGSPSGMLKTWFDFLFGDKADTKETRAAIASNFDTLNKALQEDYKFICPAEGTEYCKGNEARVDDDKNVNMCWERIKGFTQEGMARLLVHENVRRAQGFRSVTNISGASGQCGMPSGQGKYAEATTDANHPIPYSCFAEKMISIYLAEQEQTVNALLQNLRGNGVTPTYWSGTIEIGGKAQPVSAALHVSLVDTSFVLNGTYSYDRPEGGKASGEITFGTVRTPGPAGRSEALIVEFDWLEGGASGHGVWRGENETTLKGTWGRDKSKTDGGAWTMSVAVPEKKEGK